MGVSRSITRLSWMRRKPVALAALLLFVLGLRLVWGWWVGSRTEAALARLRHRGEPATVADLVYPYVPRAENAFVVQSQAAASLNAAVESPRSSMLEYEDYPPYPAEWMKLAAASEQAHRKAFTLLRQARPLTNVQFRTSLATPAVNTLLPYLNDLKWLANTVTDGAKYAHVRGDDAEAIERLIDALHLARSLHQDDPAISQLVAIGIGAMVCADVQILGPGLKLDDQAVRDGARELIARLLDEETVWAGLRRAIVFERLMWIDYRRDAAKSTWVIRPAADHAILRVLPWYELRLQAVRQRTWPAARALLDGSRPPDAPPRGWLYSPPDRRVMRYSRWFQGDDLDIAGYVERHFRAIAARRVAAVSLAWQLYRAERGRRPERLEELSPEYLERLPADPYHGDGRPVGYVVRRGGLPGGGDRPMLYFDAGPDEEVIEEKPLYGWYLPWKKLRGTSVVRQYRDLTRFAPPSEPVQVSDHDAELLREFERAMRLEEAVDDHPDEPDAPGEGEEEEDGVP